MTDKLPEPPEQIMIDLQRRLEQALAQQAATADVLKLISRSTFDLQTVLETLIRSAVKLCGANRGSIFLRKGDVFPLRAASSTTPEFLQYWAANPARAGRGSATSRVIASGKVEIIPDVLADPDMEMPAGSLNKIRAALGVPMLRDNKVEGVMVLTRPEPGPFPQSQIDLVQSFADQGVIAIENTRLFRETQDALDRQTATAEILKVIASSPSDVQPVFDAIANRSKQLIGGFSCTVFRLIDGIVHLVAYTSVSAVADEVLKGSFPRPVGEMSLFDMAKGRDVFEEPDAEDNPDARLRELARARGFRSTLFARLMSKGTPIGLIAVTRTQPGSFDPHHVELLRTFADQAVIAIENARLFDEVQAKTSDLEESLQQQIATADVLKVISRSAFDLDLVMNTLTQSAADLCKADFSALYLRQGEVLVARGLAHTDPAQADFLRRTPLQADSSTYVGRTLLAGSIRNIADYKEEKEAGLLEKFGDILGFRSILFVPLMREARGVGVFALARKQIGRFSLREVDLVQTFADQAVIAIENVRLFDEVQARTRELSQSLQELRTAQDRLVQTEKLASLGQLTAGIAHEIKNPLNFVNNFSSLSAELIDELQETLAPAPLDQKMRGDIGELTAMLKSNLEKVVQHGKRADSIVKNMLLHSREGSREHRTSDLNAIVEDSLNLAYHGARAEKAEFAITLRPDLDPHAGAVELYPQEITRALLNLISNGFYAATRRKADCGDENFEPMLSASTRSLGNAVEIRIRDNGTGIAPEVKEKIFLPFFTTKPTGEGTGLGLSMTHDIIVKQHGGRIDVETELGAFTEFIITLPRGTGNAAGLKSE